MDNATAVSSPRGHPERAALGSRDARAAARRKADPEMQGISRDERPARPVDAGWRVRLFKEGRYVANRHFRDAAYQGREAALRAAKRFRDDMAMEFGVPRRSSHASELSGMRLAAGLSQSTLARWLHMSTPLIARWERVGAPDGAIRLVAAMLAGRVSHEAAIGDLDLLAIRMSLGLSQEELASKFARSYNAYGEWERGNRPVPGWVTVYLHALSCGWDESMDAVDASKEPRGGDDL